MMLFAERKPRSDPQAGVLLRWHGRRAVFDADIGDDGILTKTDLVARKAVIAAEFAVLDLRFTRELSLLRAEAVPAGSSPPSTSASSPSPCSSSGFVAV